MKKIPLVFSGCLLGLVGAGNLLADSLPILAHAFSLTGLFFWFFFLVYHAIRWQETKIELQQPALLSGMATFPMAGMILSTYLFRLFPAFGGLSQLVWWSAFLLDLCLILYFTKTHVMARPRAKATPSWTVLYVGIAVAALTYPVVGVMGLAYLSLGVGFVLTLCLYPLIYQDLKTSPLPSHLLGQEGIYCAPFSLLLAALVRVGGAGLPSWVILIMVVISQAFYFFVFPCYQLYSNLSRNCNIFVVFDKELTVMPVCLRELDVLCVGFTCEFVSAAVFCPKSFSKNTGFNPLPHPDTALCRRAPAK